MTLRVRDIPGSYTKAKELLNGRSQRKVSKNGWLITLDVEQYIILKLYGTAIVRYYPDGRMYLSYGMYPTRTTATWINKALGFSSRVSLAGWRFGYYGKLVLGGGSLNMTYDLPVMINGLGVPITEGERSVI